MKKIVSYAACLLIITSVAAAPDSKLLKSFNETFPNARNIKWNDDKAGYFVSFMQDGNFEKVLYSKSGEFVCSWKYSDGKNLPTNILMDLKKKYDDYKMIGVTEYASQSNTQYEVKISKNDKLYSAKFNSNLQS